MAWGDRTTSSTSAIPTYSTTEARIEESWPEDRRSVASFDGGVRAQVAIQRPDRYRFWRAKARTPSIARGAGLSYAAASFRAEGLSVEHTAFDRVLDFDSAAGVVEVESGISLGALHRFLRARGLFLKAQPGYGRITVGGCIATDAHGKNQARDGTFINQVAGLTLLHPTQGAIEVNDRTEPDLFRLTCGGYGLTGHILKARLRASLLPSSGVEVRVEPVDDVATGTRRLAQLADEADFVYSWHDFTLSGASFGRGLAIAARFDPDAGTADFPRAAEPELFLSAASRGGWRLPLLNRWSTRILNALYPGLQLRGGGRSRIGLDDALFPVHAKQAYFKLFGAAGFHECQAIIPLENVTAYTDAIRDYLRRRPVAITLASGKIFRGGRDLLRFSGDGLCLALNFPRTRASGEFLQFLDALITSVRGVPSIIKDSRLPAPVVDATYPEAQRFRDRLRSFDPARWFRSELSDRLHL